jgi:asparagine synthase (glutamine-hydrolysing)
VPGLHLIVSAQFQKCALDLPDLTRPLRHNSEYRHDCIIEDGGTVCFTTSYPGYPITVIDTERHLCVVEGHIYGHSESSLRAALGNLINSSIWESNACHDDISRWLQDNVGEFVVAIRDKTSRRWVVVNDILGRLPLYYARTDSHIVVSREYPLFHNQRFSPRWDRQAVAERLWLGFVCGSATLLQGVRRLPPASILQLDPTAFSSTGPRLRAFF